MSKKKHRHRGQSETENVNNQTINTPFGINPSQLMSMLGGNIDIGQIGNMLSKMRVDGLDLNNFNLGQLSGMNNQNISNTKNTNNSSSISGFDLGAIQGMMNNLGLGNINNIDKNLPKQVNSNIAVDNKENLEEKDENIEMLIAIKRIVNEKRGLFIDKIIEAYKNGDFK